jgi:membrane fusion protein, multidrug efflux system
MHFVSSKDIWMPNRFSFALQRIARAATLAALAIFAILFSGACSGEAVQSTPAVSGRGGGQNATVPVTIAPVVQKPMPIDVEGIGTVIAASTVSVRSQITGEMTSVRFKEGDEVEKGQVLVTIDRRPFEAALQQAEAALARDEAQLANAKSQANRYQDLMKRGIATREQIDQINANAAALEATVGADRAVVDNAKLQLEYATITAPIAGRTGLLQVHPGNLIRANDTTPIVTINKVTPVYVSFAVPEAQLPELKRYLAKGELSVIAQPPDDAGPPSKGVISFVDNAIDMTTGTIKVKGTFPNTDRRLWPGQYVNATVTLTSDPGAIVVPSVAVQTGQQGQYVFVVKTDQTVELRTVTVARSNSVETVIRSGLKPGESVVTDGQLRLVAGSHITVKGASAQKATS